MGSYYQLLDRQIAADNTVIAKYRPLISSQGAWNENEQHMAPASGVITAELEKFSPRDDMRIGRISFDIFGLIELTDFTIKTQLIRPGKTIELIESTMTANGKTCLMARTWRMCTQNSEEVAALEDQPVGSPDNLPIWDGMQRWSGGYIASLIAKTDNTHRPGKAVVWLSNDLEMIEGKVTSDFVRLVGMIDTANGTAPRQVGKFNWMFPNLDLQLHFYRYPVGKWLGLETSQQYGKDGIGLTSSVLHDIHGPFGHCEQILTLRKI